MMNSSSDAAGTDLAKLPETPTPEERAVLSVHIARRKQKRPSPRIKLVEKAGSSVELSADHPIPHLGNALIMESLGTADFDFYNGLLPQLLANVGTQENSEGLERMRRANTRHGIYSEERRRLMQAVRKLVREARQTAEET
jgi:hypothetical protein